MDIKRLKRISAVAVDLGVAKTTIFAAINRGEIKAYRSLCDFPMVEPRDVKKWLAKKDQRKPGPKVEGKR